MKNFTNFFWIMAFATPTPWFEGRSADGPGDCVRHIGWDHGSAMHILAALTALGDDPCREDADVKKLTGPSGFYRLRIFVVRAGDRRDVHRGI